MLVQKYFVPRKQLYIDQVLMCSIRILTYKGRGLLNNIEVRHHRYTLTID